MSDVNKLISEIRREALGDDVSLASVLRKCVSLGGDTGSKTLRDWASKELKGYRGEDLPEYRRVGAVIQMDGTQLGAIFEQHSLSAAQLPEPVRDYIPERVPLAQGVGELEAIAKRASGRDEAIKLSLPGGAEIAALMTHEAAMGVRIDRVYWALSPTVVEGALDHIRTALVELVTELGAFREAGADLTQAADNAVHFVVTGERNTVNVVTTQHSPGTAVTTDTRDDAEDTWSVQKKLIAVAGAVSGLLTAAAGIVKLL